MRYNKYIKYVKKKEQYQRGRDKEKNKWSISNTSKETRKNKHHAQKQTITLGLTLEDDKLKM
jgi:hypothetical protein